MTQANDNRLEVRRGVQSFLLHLAPMWAEISICGALAPFKVLTRNRPTCMQCLNLRPDWIKFQSLSGGPADQENGEG